MPYTVRCKACSSSFAIPDEIWDKRVKGRVATLKCRACKGDIQVDGNKAGVPMASQSPPARRSRPPSEVPPEPSQPRLEQPKLEQPKLEQAKAPAPVAEPLIKQVAARADAAVKSPALPTTAATPKTALGAVALPSAAKTAAPVISTVGHGPAAKGAGDIVAPESGWSLMPPPGELEQVGISPKPAPVTAAGSPPVTTTTQTTAAAPVEAETAEELPPDPDLWVVSYGDDDDREMTEKDIAAELANGHITLSTIVWQDGMPEWLPISGVQILAKYAPQPKPAPARQARTSPAGKASTTAAARPLTAGAGATGAGKTPSVAQRRPALADEKPSGGIQLEPKASKRREGGDPELPAVLRGTGGASPQTPAAQTQATQATQNQATQNQAAQTQKTQSQATVEAKIPKGPPPLSKAAERQSEKQTDQKPGAKPPPLAAGSRVPEVKTAAKAPALTRRGQAKVESATPWELSDDGATAARSHSRQDSSEQIFTSAPDLGSALKPHADSKAETSPAASPPAIRIVEPALGAVVPTPSAPAVSVPRSTPSQRPSAKSSMRPPKPVETATSLVLRTEAGTPHDLLISDEDFLAMQRRHPKWALPAGIAGGLALLGLFIWAVNAAEAPPQHAVTTTTVVDTLPRENLAHQQQPRHQQPDLSAIPTAAHNAAEEKDFAKLFAQSASKTNSTFDAKAAEQAALNMLDLASRCRVAPDEPGQARVVVTFATAGHVLSVQVGSPYASTPTGKCIEKVLRSVKSRPFQGEAGRLPLTVPIR